MSHRPYKAPLYRKVNTTARGVRHNFGGEFRNHRHAKGSGNEELTHTSMGGKVRRGLDYTPLFRFLLSKVGQDWTEVSREAVARLDRPDPIYWLVARQEHERREIVCVGESTYYSGLFIDEDGRLQVVNPSLNASSLSPQCKCCTHTFNGERFTQAFNSDPIGTMQDGESNA